MPEETTQAEDILAAINATLENKATADQQAYMIGTRRLDRIPVDELRRLRSDFIVQVRAEKGKLFGSVRMTVS